MRQGLPILLFERARLFKAWLEAHHGSAKGLWLKIAKKGNSTVTVTYAQALEAALCHGWIDGQKAALDEAFWLQRFTPRGPNSKWSKINRDKALALIETRRMQPHGLAAIEAARRDGRWDQAYDPQSQATIPHDLQSALDANPVAAEFFEGLDRLNRYAVLHRLQTARSAETRSRHLVRFILMLNRREKLYP